MILGAFERMVAMRYLRARRQEGFVSVIAWFSLLGIGLGVATLIIVMSVMGGFRTEFVGQFLGINAPVSVYRPGAPLTNFDSLAAKLRSLPSVTSVIPQVQGQTVLAKNGSASGVLVRGLTPENFGQMKIVSGHIVAGKIADFGEGRIAIGARLAEEQQLKVGDELTLISPKMTSTPIGPMLNKRIFEVAAIFSVGNYLIDNGVVFMPMEAAQSFFQTGDGVSSLEVGIVEPEEGLAAAERSIRQAAGPEFRVYDWKSSNATYLNALDTERSVMFLILTLIILVAAFNIISSLIMLVKDKGADIAILRTMGATRGMVMRIFFLTGASIGIIGAFSGVLLGVLFVKNIENIRHLLQSLTGTDLFAAQLYFFTQIPAKLDWTQVLYIVSIALGLSFLASIVPAWRASRVDPVEALRYE